MNTFFSFEQILPLYVSIVFLLSSILLYSKSFKWSCVTLGIGVISMSYFAGMLDPFLNIWDEQFHALVAKNTAKNFRHPKLFPAHPLGYDYTVWAGNYTWLHKQPLFIWQISASLQVFGNTVFAVRFPSILMHSVMCFFIFRMGFLLINRRTGYIAALLFGVTYFPLEQVSGFYASDHNDVAFLFYVTASLWAYLEYEKSKKKYWIVLIGLFSGCAVLVKWLVGLLVYLPWGLNIFYLFFKEQKTWKYLLPFATALGICVFLFLPWQIYIHIYFPKEAMYEASYNVLHFTKALEGHSGSWDFYIKEGTKFLYGRGDLMPYFILLSIVLLLLKIKVVQQRILIFSTIVVVYVFFSIAATKMLAFVLIVSPFIFIAIGHLIDISLTVLFKKLAKKWLEKLTFIFLMPFLLYGFSNIKLIEENHTLKLVAQNNSRLKKNYEMKIISEVKTELGDDKYVIFYSGENCNNILMMFFTDHIVYDFLPSEEQIQKLVKQKYKIAIIENIEIPIELRCNKNCRIIEVSKF